jgi:hypothetical protein
MDRFAQEELMLSAIGNERAATGWQPPHSTQGPSVIGPESKIWVDPPAPFTEPVSVPEASMKMPEPPTTTSVSVPLPCFPTPWLLHAPGQVGELNVSSNTTVP